jgi:hypothetical protein
MNYGTIRIVDGTHQSPPASGSRSRSGFAKMELGSDGALAPVLESSKTKATTLVVELNYNDYAYLYAGQKAPLITSVYVGYKKSIKRLAQGGNPVASATRLVSDLAGCDEAKKVRGRAIALSRIRKTISEETFKFRLGDA